MQFLNRMNVDRSTVIAIVVAAEEKGRDYSKNKEFRTTSGTIPDSGVIFDPTTEKRIHAVAASFCFCCC
jgi:hypothetical protein